MSEMIGQEPAIGISLNVQIGNGRSLVFQTHVSQGVEDEGLNGLCDKLVRSADRLTKHYEVEALDSELERQKDMLDDLDKKQQQLDGLLDAKEKHLMGLAGSDEARLSSTQRREKEKLAAEVNAERQQRTINLTNRQQFLETLARAKARREAAIAAAV